MAREAAEYDGLMANQPRAADGVAAADAPSFVHVEARSTPAPQSGRPNVDPEIAAIDAAGERRDDQANPDPHLRARSTRRASERTHVLAVVGDAVEELVDPRDVVPGATNDGVIAAVVRDDHVSASTSTHVVIPWAALKDVGAATPVDDIPAPVAVERVWPGEAIQRVTCSVPVERVAVFVAEHRVASVCSMVGDGMRSSDRREDKSDDGGDEELHWWDVHTSGSRPGNDRATDRQLLAATARGVRLRSRAASR